MTSRCYGQGVAEYGLAGLLVAVVSLAALYTLGETVSPIFANMLGGSFRANAASLAAGQTGVGASSGAASSAGGAANGAASGTNVALGGGASAAGITVPASLNIPLASTASSQGGAQTTGALGSSQQTLASAVKSSPSAAPAASTSTASTDGTVLTALITDLANNGHQIGSDLQAAAIASTVSPQTGSTLVQQAVDKGQTQLSQLKSQLGQYLIQNPTALTTAQKLSINSAIMSVTVQTAMVSSDPGAAHDAATKVHGASNVICRNGGNSKKCIR